MAGNLQKYEQVKTKINLTNLICYLSVFTIGLGSSVPGILTPIWVDRLALDTSTLGLFYGLQTIATLACGFILGSLADRGKKAPLLFISLAMYIMGFLIMANAHSFFMIALGLILLGPGHNGLVIISSAHLVQSSGIHADTRIARLNFSFSIAAVIGPWLVKWIGYSQVFLLSITIAFVPTTLMLLILLGFFKEATKKREIQKPLEANQSEKSYKSASLLTFGKSAVLWFVGIATFAYAGIEGGLVAWMPYYFANNGQKLLLEPALWTSWYFFTFMIGRLTYSRIVHRIKPSVFIFAMVSSMLIPAVLWIFFGSGTYLLVLVALFGLFCAGIYPAIQIILANFVPGSMGMSGIWMMIFGSFANMFWPAFTGRGLSVIGISFVPIMLMLQISLLFSMMYLVRKNESKYMKSLVVNKK